MLNNFFENINKKLMPLAIATALLTPLGELKAQNKDPIPDSAYSEDLFGRKYYIDDLDDHLAEVKNSISKKTFLGKSPENFEKTITLFKTPGNKEAYLKNIQKIKSAGMSPYFVVGKFDPKLILDDDYIDAYIAISRNVPISLRETLNFYPDENMFANLDIRKQIFTDPKVKSFLNTVAELDKDHKFAMLFESSIMEYYFWVNTPESKDLNILDSLKSLYISLKSKIPNFQSFAVFVHNSKYYLSRFPEFFEPKNTKALELYSHLRSVGYQDLEFFYTGPDQARGKKLKDMFLERINNPVLYNRILEIAESSKKFEKKLSILQLGLLPDEVIMSDRFMENYSKLENQGLTFSIQVSGEKTKGFVHRDFLEFYAYVDKNRAGDVINFLSLDLDEQALDKIKLMLKTLPAGDASNKVLASIFRTPKIFLEDKDYIDFFLTIFKDPSVIKGDGIDLNFRTVIDKKLEQVYKKNSYQIQESLGEFIRLRAENKNLLIAKIFSHLESGAYLDPIFKMNEHHNSSDSARLKFIEKYDAKTIFHIMSLGGRDAYLSSFRLAYDGKQDFLNQRSRVDSGFIGKINSECKIVYSEFAKKCQEQGGLYVFLKDMAFETQVPQPERKSPNPDFISLVKFLSQHDIVDKFLLDIGEEKKQREIFQTLFFSQLKTKNITPDIGSITDLLKAKNILSEMTVGYLKDLIDSGDQNKVAYAKSILIHHFYTKKTANPSVEIPIWLEQDYQNHADIFKNITVDLDEKSLWVETKSGNEVIKTHTQIFVSYNDSLDSSNPSHWDGHQSVDNILRSIGGKLDYDRRQSQKGKINNISVGKNWQIMNNGEKNNKDVKGKDWRKDGYVMLVKKLPGNKYMRHIIVLPNQESQSETSDLAEAVMRDYPPQVVHNVGHSYHGGYTLYAIERHQRTNKSIVFANMRSCGGEFFFSGLFHAGITSMFGTRGVGTMLVNDPFTLALNKKIESGNVNFAQLRNDFEKRANLDPRYNDYVWPDQNQVTFINVLMEQLLRDNQN